MVTKTLPLGGGKESRASERPQMAAGGRLPGPSDHGSSRRPSLRRRLWRRWNMGLSRRARIVRGSERQQTKNAVYLFPDTNVFVQCKPLDQVDWNVLGEVEKVHLIVARPVQSEIDGHKHKGNDRLANRARAASSMFRRVLAAPEGCVVIRGDRPQVTLSLGVGLKPSPGLEALDLDQADDALVGIGHAFTRKYPDRDVRILTHDVGPMASAKAVGVQFVEVPAEWLLAPEPTGTERRLAALEKKFEELKRNEPAFEIQALGYDSQRLERLETSLVRYPPLTDAQVATLMVQLKERFPPEMDFRPRETAERTSPRTLIGTMYGGEVFTPATAEEISAYQNELYPEWLSVCETKLRRLHDLLNGRSNLMLFHFSIVNNGARPGRDVLVTVRALGDFQLFPLSDAVSEDSEDGGLIELPPPPKPPKGKWQPRVLANLPNISWPSPHMLGVLRSRQQRSLVDSLSGYRVAPKRRDPNALYWKPSRPTTAGKTLQLECEQWRHAADAKGVGGEIVFPDDVKEVRGALECEIHAENLSSPAALRVPVRLEVQPGNAYDEAERMMARL